MHCVAHNLELKAVDVLKKEKKQAMAEVETTCTRKGVSSKPVPNRHHKCSRGGGAIIYLVVWSRYDG